MHVMLTNKGTTPLPIGTPDAGGVEGLLPPGLEIAIANDTVGTFVVGEQPEPAGRSKLKALEVDPESPLAIEYGTDIDQWKGRSDETAEQATMHVVLGIKNVGADNVVVTTTEGVTTLTKDEGVVIETLAGLKVQGAVPQPPDPPDPGDTTGTITAFSAENPTSVAMDTQDQSMLAAGDFITLEALTGDPDAMAFINMQSVQVVDVGPPVMLDLDMTAQNVDGLTADFEIDTPDSNPTTLPPPWIFRNVTQINPVVATVDDVTGLNQGDYVVFTGIEGTQAQMDYVNGQGGQVQSINGNIVQVGYNGSAMGDATGLVMSAVLQ